MSLFVYCRNAALLLQMSKFKAQKVWEYKDILKKLCLFLYIFIYKKVKLIKVNLQTKNKSGMHALYTSVL